MGLVTVALLTLAPLALRPVRLACLIHAANVHSEPGSNPSKVVEDKRPRRPEPAAPLLNAKRVEESDWSHRDDLRPADRGQVPRLPTPGHPDAGWCCRPHRLPSPTWRTTAVSRPAHHAGFPQGFTIKKHDLRSTGLSKSYRRHRPVRLPHFEV